MKKIIIPIAMAGLLFSCSGPASTQSEAVQESKINQEVMELDSITKNLDESTETLKKKAEELEELTNEL